MRYVFIAAQSRRYPVFLLCELMRVSRAAYYRWRGDEQAAAAARREERERLAELVKKLFIANREKVGSRVLVALLRQRGERVGRYLVRALMREQGLACVIRRGYRGGKTKSAPACYPCLRPEIASAIAPNKAWVSDITYIRTLSGWRYLAVVMDACSRRIIGWDYQPAMRADIVLNALRRAVAWRKPAAGLIIHSDRGAQYNSGDYRDYLSRCRFAGSMSGLGNCYDNAMMERFFGTLKDHLVVGEELLTAAEMKSKIAAWIELDYNHLRPSSALGNQSPAQFEEHCANMEAIA